jgi:hypothetical protein
LWRGEGYTGLWWENLRERDHLGDPGVDGRIILRWIFRKWDVSDSVGSDKDNRGVSCLNSGRGTSSLKRGWYCWETMKWIHLA